MAEYYDNENLQQYALSNPVKHLDPSGRWTVSIGVLWLMNNADDGEQSWLGRNGMVLEMSVFSLDGCTLVSAQMVVRQWKKWTFTMDRTISGPTKVLRKNDQCPTCKMECVYGTATGVWSGRVFHIGYEIYLRTQLELTLWANGTGDGVRTSTKRCIVGQDQLIPVPWDEDGFSPVPDWSFRLPESRHTESYPSSRRVKQALPPYMRSSYPQEGELQNAMCLWKGLFANKSPDHLPLESRRGFRIGMSVDC